MGIFGYLSRTEAKSLVQDALAKRSDKRLVSQLNAENLDRAKADVSKWRQALDEWEDSVQPDRYNMMQLYQEIIQDDSVATHLNTIIRSIEGTELEIGQQQGDEFKADPQASDIFKGEWYSGLIRHFIEAEMQGYTLVEITPAEQAKRYSSDNLTLIPRELVIPERRQVRTRPQVDIGAIDYTLPQYKSRLLEIGDTIAKGLFNNLTLLYIYKKNALAFWANYQSKFGIPPIVVKTDLSDTNKVATLTNFLENMRNNTFAMVGFDDEIETLAGVPTDAYSTFQELINHCDSQIAKVMEGQTMTSNDGSSRSQAEVHERIAEEFHQARLRRLEWLINEALWPIIVQDFPQLEGKRFQFKERKNLDEIIDRAAKLYQAGYQIEQEYLEQVTGMPLTPIQKAPSPAAVKIQDAINELYYKDTQCC